MEPAAAISASLLWELHSERFRPVHSARPVVAVPAAKVSLRIERPPEPQPIRPGLLDREVASREEDRRDRRIAPAQLNVPQLSRRTLGSR